ncbi:unnamed protein product [Auanema sp. JU1783]|nr:unnamed protein product [Auanema sp. JU1783]
MLSLRKFFCRPRPDDWCPLAKFYYADEALTEIANELDSFDGKRDPDRCTALVHKLRIAQDRLLHIIEEMIIILYPIKSERANRDFRAKFPDEIVHDNLPGQLWFGAECLSAGSNIVDHEFESECIRPLAKAVTAHLDYLRSMLKDQALRNPREYTHEIKKSLLLFDHMFANFEFQYVSAMVSVKTSREHDAQQLIAVLFADTLQRALRCHYITQEQIEYFDPAVMFIIPRLAVLWGLLHYPEGALNLDPGAENELSDMFRPYIPLLQNIKKLLKVLTVAELSAVENILCSGEDESAKNKQSALDFNDDNSSKLFIRARKDQTTENADNDSKMENVVKDDNDSGAVEDEDHVNENEQGAGLCFAVEYTNADDTIEAFCVERSDRFDLCGREDIRGIQDNPLDELVCVERNANTPPPSEDELSTFSDSKAETHELVVEEAEATKSVTKTLRTSGDFRIRYVSSDDMIHRIFVCVSAVADQLQTNYSSDVRKLLKMVLFPTEDSLPVDEIHGQTAETANNEEETGVEVNEHLPMPPYVGVRWVPDDDVSQCTSCYSSFTFIRRRHHCRNCGRIFCGSCSRKSIEIPDLGYDSRVRVCNLCYLSLVHPFLPCSSGDEESDNETSSETAVE